MIKKHIKVWIVISLFIIVMVFVLPFPIRVDKTLLGVNLYLDEPEKVKEDKMIVKGIYFQYLVRDDVFQGDIRIEGADPNFDYTLANEKVTLYRTLDGSMKYFSPMFYSKSRNEVFVLGNFNIKDIFDEVYMNYSGSNNYWFVAPAKDRKDAIEKMRQLSLFIKMSDAIIS